MADPEGPWLRPPAPSQPAPKASGPRAWNTAVVVAGLLFAAAVLFFAQALTGLGRSWSLPLLIILVLLAVARARGTKRFDPLVEPGPGDRPRNVAVLIALVLSSLWAFLGLFYWLLSFFAADFDDEDSAADERAAALGLRIFGTVILVWTITNIVAATHHLRGERWARVVLVASFGIVAVLGLAAGIAFFPGGLILGLPHLAAGVAVVVIAVREEGATPTLR